MKVLSMLLLVPLAAVAAGVRAPAVPAPDVVFTGTVTDAASGSALPSVQVSVDAVHTTLTDASGRYVLTVPSAARRARMTISAAAIGYGSYQRAVRVSGDTVVVDIALSTAKIRLEANVVQSAPAATRAQLGFAMGDASMQSRVAAEWNTESYDHIAENGFRSVATSPLSTFSIDVDRASYSNVRRMIRGGALPPKDAVRIEELVNYFPYTAAEPARGEPFAVATELMRAPWQPQHLLARISLHAPRMELRDLPANNLVFLLDVSGSMAAPNKLPLLKQALRLLVNELREQDRVAIVVYAGNAGLVLESTSGADRERILDALERLEAGGSTAGGAGLLLAYDIARRHHIRGGNNRIVLATDGDFNIGVSSDAEMIRLVEEKRAQGTFLTVLGFGMGNLKESKLEKLADHGNGNYAYIDDLMEARKVLVTEFGGTLLTVAKDVKLQVEFNPAHVRAYRLIGYENRLLANEDFADDTKDAGEIGAGHTVTALYELVPAGVESTITLREPEQPRYQQSVELRGSSFTNELGFIRLRYKRPDGDASRLLERPIAPRVGAGSDDIRFASAVAAFGMLLRESEHRGRASFELVAGLAADALADDPGGYRREFLAIVEAARTLSRSTADGDER
jgi:Ca-activated chloride channel family protein